MVYKDDGTKRYSPESITFRTNAEVVEKINSWLKQEVTPATMLSNGVVVRDEDSDIYDMPDALSSNIEYAYLNENKKACLHMDDGSDVPFASVSDVTALRDMGGYSSFHGYYPSFVSVRVVEDDVEKTRERLASAADVVEPAVITDGVLTGVSDGLICNGTYLIPEGVTEIGDKAFSYCRTLEHIEIPESVTWIGDGAFEGCESLKDVQIPDSVNGIGKDAFRWCNSLEHVKIPNSVASIGEWAFSDCDNLKTVVLPEGITDIKSHTFNGCVNMEHTNIPDGVTNIGDSAFRNCYKLKAIEIPDSVKRINDWAFHGCLDLKSINLSDSITDIGNYAFAQCKSLETVNIPGSISCMSREMFFGCDHLKEVGIADGVHGLGNSVFGDCSALEHIEIPDSVTYIGGMAFENCNNLKEVTLSSCDIQDDAFVKCGNLENVNFRSNVSNSIVKNAIFQSFLVKNQNVFGPNVDFHAVSPNEKTTETAKSVETGKDIVKNFTAAAVFSGSSPEKRNGNEGMKKAVAAVKEGPKQAPTSDGSKKGSNMLMLKKDRVKATKKEGVSCARIGLNSEHGKYGTIFFDPSKLRDSKKNPNVTYLPMSGERSYNVSFQGENGKHNVVRIKGSEIVGANKAFMEASNRQRMTNLESQVQTQMPQSESQTQAGM